MGSSIKLVENTSREVNQDNKLQQKLLLVESDHYLSQAFLVNDNHTSFQIKKIRTEELVKQDLKNYLMENRPNMIVFDLGEADNKQLSLLQDISSIFEGLLVVVSGKTGEQEELESLKLGADDYLLKPIDSRILMLRIEGLFRRQSHKVEQVDIASLTMGDVCLKPKSQKCFINGEGVKLTTFEFNLLKSLVEHQGNILSRDELYSTLLRRTYNGVERTLDVRMSQLREKLTVAGMKDNQIETVWGQGYMFNHISA